MALGLVALEQQGVLALGALLGFYPIRRLPREQVAISLMSNIELILCRYYLATYYR